MRASAKNWTMCIWPSSEMGISSRWRPRDRGRRQRSRGRVPGSWGRACRGCQWAVRRSRNEAGCGDSRRSGSHLWDDPTFYTAQPGQLLCTRHRGGSRAAGCRGQASVQNMPRAATVFSHVAPEGWTASIADHFEVARSRVVPESADAIVAQVAKESQMPSSATKSGDQRSSPLGEAILVDPQFASHSRPSWL